MTSDTFDPRTYIHDLQIQGSEDWVIVVEGGEPQRGGRLRVRHQETLTFALQPPSTSSEEESDSDGEDDDEGGDEGQGESSPDLSILHSSDESGPPPDYDGPPRGPPPPQPMDRSRSPRRGHAAETEGPTTDGRDARVLMLARSAPSASFRNGPGECMYAPTLHSIYRLLDMFGHLNGCSWTSTALTSKQATLKAMAGLVPWTSLLLAANGVNTLAAHLYTDGSYDPGGQVSGSGDAGGVGATRAACNTGWLWLANSWGCRHSVEGGPCPQHCMPSK